MSAAMAPANLVEVTERAQARAGVGDVDGAIAIYEEWLATAASPFAWAACYNLGVLCADSGRTAAARGWYEQGAALNPDCLEARFNLGNLLEKDGKPEEALAQWQGLLARPAARLARNRATKLLALNNIGRLAEQQRRYDEAERHLAQSLLLDPEQPEVVQHWVHLRQRLCRWPIQLLLPGVTEATLRKGISALAVLNITDDIATQRAAAERFIAAKVPQPEACLAGDGDHVHDRIRVGYLSSDLCMHAVSFLTVQLFELHDRQDFEIYAFSWSRNDGSGFQQRVLGAFDHVVGLHELSDAEAAERIHALEIDILVDLQGLTSGARPAILARRPAPVQIAYLGFPGTAAVPGVDYLLADCYLIPEELAGDYAETPLYLPDCFQVSDAGRPVEKTLSRAEYGLPEAGVVFCAFNNTHKITAEIFGTWLDILKAVPDSVLWLLADTPHCRTHLENEALMAGVPADRLVFADRLAPPGYLARFGAADLFLDTFPFNGGTTANDALFMGLPVLTCSGRAFASRMAGSLLTCLGLPELITTSLPAYADAAIRLATTPGALAALRSRLAQARATSPLFDTPRRVRDIEAVYRQVARCRRIPGPPRPASPRPALEEGIFLHVGCGRADKQSTTPGFAGPAWREIRLDIDPDAQPDVIGSMTAMPAITDAAVDAVFSSHNLEHLYPHEVPLALAEFLRVLRPAGYLVLTCPDLHAVCRQVVEVGLTDPAYLSPAGPIAPLDMLYGHQQAMAAGNLFMAHRCGFTQASLAAALRQAGFGAVRVVAAPAGLYDLWAIACKADLPARDLAAIAAAHFPLPFRHLAPPG